MWEMMWSTGNEVLGDVNFIVKLIVGLWVFRGVPAIYVVAKLAFLGGGANN